MADFPLPEDTVEPSEEGMPEVAEPVTIPLAQADLAGMTGAQPGDTFTVSLTVTGSDERGIQVEVTPSEPEPPLEDLPPEGMVSKSKVRGPGALGL